MIQVSPSILEEELVTHRTPKRDLLRGHRRHVLSIDFLVRAWWFEQRSLWNVMDLLWSHVDIYSQVSVRVYQPNVKVHPDLGSW